jgi:hypothetical protein
VKREYRKAWAEVWFALVMAEVVLREKSRSKREEREE